MEGASYEVFANVSVA